MTQQLFIGVDGGATKSIIRVEDDLGNLLGQVLSGPANIRLSVSEAWHSICTALQCIFKDQHIDPNDQRYLFHAGMGLAGCEVNEAYDSFINTPHLFQTLVVSSDAHIACLAAHHGADGAVMIAGTGVVGYQIEQNKIHKTGGWGFPHDDDGGGAWLGMQAVRITLQWLDGRLPATGLAKAIYHYFSNDRHRLVSWANTANATRFATLAPIVIEESRYGELAAVKLLKQAALALEHINEALLMAQENPDQPLPCVLMGSIAPFIKPFLSEEVKQRLRSPSLTTDAGAILLIRQYLNSASLIKRSGE